MKKQYLINVKHVDNRMVIFLDGEVIWDSGIIKDDPELDQYIDITESLLEHKNYMNELIFEGFNDAYSPIVKEDELRPWHFHYRVIIRTTDDNGNVIEEKNMLAPYNEKHLSNPNIKAISNSYQIALKNNEFKVISNSLVQKFSE